MLTNQEKSIYCYLCIDNDNKNNSDGKFYIYKKIKTIKIYI